MRTRYAPLSLLSALTFFLCPEASPQQNTFLRISLDEGLSQSIVNAITQDRAGFMWFCTEDGLNRFDGYSFAVIRNNSLDFNSISHNSMTAIHEDRSGRLWVGTNNGGLNCYDPRSGRFRRYISSREDPSSPTSNFIQAILEDDNGTLWVGTLGGLCSGAKDDSGHISAGFRQYGAGGDRNSLTGNAVTCLYQDRSGVLWIGSDEGLTMIPDPSETEHPVVLRFRAGTGPAGLTHDRVRTILEDRSGTLWVGTAGGLEKMVRRPIIKANGTIEPPRFLHYRSSQHDERTLRHDDIFALLEDRFGNLWIGTNGGGVSILDSARRSFTHYRHDPLDIRSLGYNEIRSLYEDRSGNIWVGTYGGGVSKVDRGRKAFRHYRKDPYRTNTLNESIVWCVHQDTAGILWIGTHGGGLNRLDRVTGRYSFLRSDPLNPATISHNIVRCVTEDVLGRLWIGTAGGGVSILDRTTGRVKRYRTSPVDSSTLSGDDVRAISRDQRGNMYVGTLGSGISVARVEDLRRSTIPFRRILHDPSDSTGLSDNFIRSITEDRAGMIWIGTYGGGLEQYDPSAKTFTHHRTDASNPTSLSNDYVFCVHEDRTGVIWIGTWGGGLNRLDRSTGVFRNFTTREGLPSDAVYGILEDRRGRLWMSTNKGIARFDPQTETFRNFDQSDGLQSNEFNGGSYFLSKSGEMFFGGINGFNSFFPEDIRDNETIPPVVLTRFTKLNEEVRFGKPIHEIRELVLSHEDYVFSFEFAALDFTVPEKNQYQYMMEGIDPDWIPVSPRLRSATYTTLPPGDYRFRVRASNNDGLWNHEGVAIRVSITPPFWQTSWFIGLSLAVLAGALVLGYRRRVGRIEMAVELAAAHDAQMSIMPQEEPDVRGLEVSGICVPANEVGGDFYDYFWWDQDAARLGIVVGDVSGKSMRAAMTAVMAAGMVRSEAMETQSVADILRKVNLPLYAKTPKDVFVAMCCARFDMARASMTFVNAGQSKPLLKSRRSVTALEARGMTHPLGIFPGIKPIEKRVRLHAGDVLVFFTDGIPEAQNRTRQFFGTERLESFLSSFDCANNPSSVVRDAIIREVHAFRGSAPQYDDIALVVAKVL